MGRIGSVIETDRERGRESVAALSSAVGAAKREAGPGALVVAWLSDLHIHSADDYASMTDFYATHANSEANFELALNEIKALEPAADVLVLGGDLSDCNSAAQYEEFRRILDRHWPSDRPVLPLFGNHDHTPGTNAATFADIAHLIRREGSPPSASTDGLYYETLVGGWRFLALDTAWTTLDEVQRRWALDRLTSRRGDPPTALLQHIPMVSVGNWVDRYAFIDRPVIQALDRNESVRLVISGHTHKAAAWTYRRKVHVVFAACAYGIADTTGWGCVVLSRDRVHSVFSKELAGVTFDFVSHELAARPGGFRRLELPLFENSELLDPCVLPRHDDPAERE